MHDRKLQDEGSEERAAVNEQTPIFADPNKLSGETLAFENLFTIKPNVAPNSQPWTFDFTNWQPLNNQRVWQVLKRTVLISAHWAAIALLVWLGAMTVLIATYRFVDPPGSSLMLLHSLSGTKINQRWVDLEKISPNLVRAVIVSEDSRFCRHWGIDIREIQQAIKRSRNGIPRGASTLTMQLAKNLFLWPSKSYFRKALEVPLTLLIELFWSKRRIMEVYLNVVEWGPGVFGAEQAARHHFGTSARRLGPNAASLLAVSLPNPIRRRAGKPNRLTSKLARIVRARARANRSAASCVVSR